MKDLISYSDFTKIDIRVGTIISAELAKYNVNGLKGTIRLKGLMLIYFITFFQWMDEKDSSLEKTMTALDKNLDQAEKFSKFLI